MRALQDRLEFFVARMKSGGTLPATSRSYDCMDAGGSAKQDARAESPSHRHRSIHRTVGGASATRLSIAGNPNSHRAVCQAQCWSKKKRSSEYSGLPDHSDKAMIGRDFRAKRNGMVRS